MDARNKLTGIVLLVSNSQNNYILAENQGRKCNWHQVKYWDVDWDEYGSKQGSNLATL